MSDTRHDTPEPFKVDIPERALIDLDERLRRWRPPIAIADNGSWASGTDPGFWPELVEYWRHGYDWQRCQEAINRWPNYLVDIGPQRLHFIREPGTEVEGALAAAAAGPSPTAGQARSSSSCTSSTCWPIPRTMAVIRSTPSTSSRRPCPATASPARRSATTAARARSARAPSLACGTSSSTRRSTTAGPTAFRAATGAPSSPRGSPSIIR